MVTRKTRLWMAVLAALSLPGHVMAQSVTIAPIPIVEWKAVFGQVETRDRVPARARTGGTVVALDVTEGDRVSAGQRIAMVEDDKLQFQLSSIDARLASLRAQLSTAEADLLRGEQLLERGVITSQRIDQLATAVDVIKGEISSLRSQRLVVEQQITEGAILSPEDGVVLSVPISRGSVVTPGEAAAIVAGGGVFLRLSVPERHAGNLKEGDQIQIGAGPQETGTDRTGLLVKLYPQIEGGRVQADVEVDGLDARFVGRRVPVRLPVSERLAILVPDDAVHRRGGLDFVAVETGSGEARERVVVPGGIVSHDGEIWREILTGLAVGEIVVRQHD